MPQETYPQSRPSISRTQCSTVIQYPHTVMNHSTISILPLTTSKAVPNQINACLLHCVYPRRSLLSYTSYTANGLVTNTVGFTHTTRIYTPAAHTHTHTHLKDRILLNTRTHYYRVQLLAYGWLQNSLPRPRQHSTTYL